MVPHLTSFHRLPLQLAMKASPIGTAACALLISFATPCLAGSSGSTTIPAVPFGFLSAYPTMVQQGTYPKITWGINYPSIVEDYITITPPSTITSKEELECQVRVLGAGVTVDDSRGSGFSWVPTEAQISYDGGSYSRIFYGTNLQVNPNTVVWSSIVKKNKKLRFGGRYYYNKSWGPYFNSSGNYQNVRTLVNGQTPPTTSPMHTAPTLEEFIKPYLDSSGKVKIGPMDVIVFMELTHYDHQSYDPGYDLQDMVLLVTFKSKAKTNNSTPGTMGGVDSENPGGSPFVDLTND